MSRSYRRLTSLRGLAASMALVFASAGCALSAPRSQALDALDELPQPTTPPSSSNDPGTTTTTTISAEVQQCKDDHLETSSFRPRAPFDEVVATDPFMDGLRKGNKIRVGVDENTWGFAAHDPETGDIVGFEVELARRIAMELFGDAYNTDSVQLVPVVTSEKVHFVEEGNVDMTINAISMSCDRWNEVSFSAEYYRAIQKFLVRKDSKISTVADLAGRKVCVTQDSSSEKILKKEVPAAVRVPVPDRTGCLRLLQEGEVEAYFGHDSFLYGMTPQDLTLEIRALDLPPDVVVSHYGIAIAKDHEEFVRFVNGVLEQMDADGSWDDLFETHLHEPPLEIPTAPQPDPQYRD